MEIVMDASTHDTQELDGLFNMSVVTAFFHGHCLIFKIKKNEYPELSIAQGYTNGKAI